MKGVFLKEGEQVELVDPETGTEQLDLLEDERQFDTTEIERKVTSPDSNRKILEELKKYADEHEQRYGRFPKTLIFAVNDLPHTSHADQLVDICRDVFGRGDSFVAEDHRPRRSALPAHPRVPQPPEPRHRRLGGPAVHRRGHPRPGVHRLPAAGEVPHPVRADARPRHAQGREVSRQVPLHRLRLLRRHAARVLPATRRPSPPSRRTSRPARSRRSSRTSGTTGTATTTSAAWSSGCSASTRRWPARPASCSPLTSPTATWPATPAACPAALQADFTGDDEAAPRRGLPGPAGHLPAAEPDASSSPTRHEDTVTRNG